MSELPKGWVEATLGDVLEPRSEKADPSAVPDLPFLGLEDVEPYSGRVIGYGSTADMKSSVALFSTGDLLFGRLRPYLQKILIADCDGAASAEFIVMKTNRHGHLDFFSALLRSSKFLEYTALVSSGDRPRVSYESISDFNFSLPPLAEQKRIVAKLDSLNAKSARARTELARIETLVSRYKQAVLSKAFSGGGSNCDVSTDWPTVKLEEVADVGTGATPKRGNADYYASGTIPWITSGAVNQGLILQADEFITERAIQETNCKVFPAGTLVVAMYGEGKTRGKVAQLGLDAATNQALAAIQIRSSEVSAPEYVYFFLQSVYLALREEAAGGVQPNLNLSIVKAIQLPLPPLEQQHEIVRRIKSAFAGIDRLAKEAKRALELVGRLDEAILAKAFRGELAPQDENDEPASLLLDRIREARTGQPSRPKRRASATKGKVHDMARTIIEALAEAKDWLAAQELFARCGVRDGSSTEDVEKLYRQLLDLERQDKVEIEEVSDPLTGAKQGNRVRLRK